MVKVVLFLLLTLYFVATSRADHSVENMAENYEDLYLYMDSNDTDVPETSDDVAIGVIYIAFTTLGLLANGVVIFVIFCGNEISKLILNVYMP